MIILDRLKKSWENNCPEKICSCGNSDCNCQENNNEPEFVLKENLSDEEIEEIIETEYKDKNDITKNFIRKSLKKFGLGKYTYYKTEVTSSRNCKVTITCKIHGDVIVDSSYFHSNYNRVGCSKCRTFPENNGFADTIDTFESKLKDVHPEYELTNNSIYVNSVTDIELHCTKHDIIFTSRPSNLLMGKCGCSECINERLEQRTKNRIKEIGENLFRKINKEYPGMYDFSNSVYLGKSENITFKCNRCGSLITMTGEKLELKVYRHTMSLCENCWLEISYEKRGEEFKEKVETKFPGHFDLSNMKYESPKSVTGIKCNCCGETFDLRWLSNFLKGAGCPHCDCSIGETRIFNWIKTNSQKIDSYKRQKRYDSSIVSGRVDEYGVVVDFLLEISGVSYMIEYNGEQHYTWCKHFHSTIEEFEGQLRRDKNVRDYCTSNSIILIEIPYIYKSQDQINDILDRIILNKECVEDVITIPPINYYRTKKDREEAIKDGRL